MRILVLIVFAIALAGCDRATTGYTYTPPDTPGGRMCVNQCRLAHDYCIESCDLKYRGCVGDMQAQALKDYTKYTRDQFAANQPMDLYLSDFERPRTCTDARDRCNGGCENTYGVCYGNCGGKVTPVTSCPLLCF